MKVSTSMESTSSRVLIVDDMPINRMILASLLATNGVPSDQVESGRECLALCQKRDYDLILLDHRMPDFDGVDTLIALKAFAGIDFALRDALVMPTYLFAEWLLVSGMVRSKHPKA